MTSCPHVHVGTLADRPCPDCGHRVGSHAIAERGGTCDVCATIDAVRLALGAVGQHDAMSDEPVTPVEPEPEPDAEPDADGNDDA